MNCECGGHICPDHACDFFRNYGFERCIWLRWTEGKSVLTHDVAVGPTETQRGRDTTTQGAASSSDVRNASTFVIDT